MPTPKVTRFMAYEFSEEELKHAVLMNPIQKMYFSTKCAEIAEELLNLDAGSKADIADFEIQRAYKKGQLDILQHMMDLSSAVEINIKDEPEVLYEVQRDPEAPVVNLFTQSNE